MKCAVRDNLAALLLFSSILPSHAYPGGHQPRGSPTTTSLSHTLSSCAGHVSTSMPPEGSAVAKQYIASGPATTVVFPIASSSSTHLVLAPSGVPEALTQRHEPHLPLQSSLLDLLDGQDEDEEEEEECEDEEVNDTFDDELRHLAYSSRGEHHIGSLCEDTISAVFDQLEDIRAALQGHRAVLAQDKRQVVDVLDKEQAYGKQGKGLTQEQRASLEALVKGVNGYQGSLDGASNTEQTEEEAWQRLHQTTESIPYLSNATPAQLQQLLALLQLIESQQRPKKPSLTTAGSQIGQIVGEAGWLAPGESSLRDHVTPGASLQHTAPQNLAPKTQEQTVLSQIQRETLQSRM